MATELKDCAAVQLGRQQQSDFWNPTRVPAVNLQVLLGAHQAVERTIRFSLMLL